MSLKIAVIGGGINGLSSAVAIQERLKNVEVNIISEKWSTDTTSTGAAGLFRPYKVVAERESTARKWIETSATKYWELCYSKEASAAGIFEIGGYIFSNNEPELVEAREYVHTIKHFRRLEGKELDHGLASWRYGSYHSTLVIEPSIYMQYLEGKFLQSGGKKVTGRICSLFDLKDSYDIVVNCCGLAAHSLVGDTEMRPIRGQLVRVKAPWMKTFYMAENNCYIYPNSETVVLGGTRQMDDWSLEVRPEDTKRILEDCCKVVPALESCEIVNEWVGLRPSRPAARLETSFIPLECDKVLPVVHNYGHGGNGISLSWGCAVDVAERVVGCFESCLK